MTKLKIKITFDENVFELVTCGAYDCLKMTSDFKVIQKEVNYILKAFYLSSKGINEKTTGTTSP